MDGGDDSKDALLLERPLGDVLNESLVSGCRVPARAVQSQLEGEKARKKCLLDSLDSVDSLKGRVPESVGEELHAPSEDDP